MKLLQKSMILCMLLFASIQTKAQSVPFALDSMLDHTLDSMLPIIGAKSLSAAVQFPDTAVWSSAAGISSINPVVNVTTDDVYLIGSVTKTITSACILQLADQGLLGLDDSLYQWLDTFQYINPNITIRQLLRHQSGIYDVLSNAACTNAMLANQDSIWAPEDLITSFIQPAVFQPGAMWSYSNTNYFLLGMIIKRVTGNEFYTEYRNRFFSPLGLSTFAIPAFEPLTSPIAHVWLDITNDGVTDDAHNFYMNYMALNSVAGAAGGYFSTASDLTKWTRTYMRGDLLSANMMAEAKTTVVATGQPGLNYGLGLMKRNFLGYQGYGHGGDLAYAASSWYFPAKDISITVLTNDADHNSWTLIPVVNALLRTYNDWSLLSGIDQTADQNFVTYVYPNPFTNSINIKMNIDEKIKSVSFMLTNALGQEIETIERNDLAPGQEEFQMNDLSSLHSGVYFIHSKINGQPSSSIKLIK